jgi:tetratricopeptide (TPR) repeat protein
MEDQEHLAPRLLAFAALWSLLSGLLLVLSFVAVALAAFAVLFAVMMVVGGKWVLARVSVGERLWAVLALAGQTIGRLRPRLHGVGVRRHLRRLGSSVRNSAAATPGRANLILARAVRGYVVAVYRVRMWVWRLLAAHGRAPTGPRTSRALELNELGAELRRRGDHEQAAEQHRVALELVRDVGDEEAEALTLNSLALALAQGGAQAEAIQHLERAATVLRKLGDEEHEGQVIANLGIVYRRQGDSEQAVQFLHQALDKLPPESSTYRKVEEELRRVS